MIKRLVYLSATQIPSEKAASVQQVRMCEAFQECGLEVEFVHPRYWGYKDGRAAARVSDPEMWSYYGVDTRFARTALPSMMSDQRPSVLGMEIPGVGGLSMTASVMVYWLWRHLRRWGQQSETVVYSRSIHASYVVERISRVLGLKIPGFYEAHDIVFVPGRWLYERTLPRLDGVVAITKPVKEGLVEQFGMAGSAITVEPDGVKLERFGEVCSMEEGRRRLGLPGAPTKIVGFAGSLYPGRGGEQLVEAATWFDDRVRFLLVGGPAHDVERIRAERDRRGLGERVDIRGRVPPSEVPLYLSACDVLVAPYTTKIPTAGVMSPLKVFEYMATRRPMVVCHLPVLEEVLRDGVNCLMVPSGDAHALAAGIERVLGDRELGNRLAGRAYGDVAQYTWRERARRIVKFIEDRGKGVSRQPAEAVGES